MKKVTVEVFTDADYTYLDGDEVAHALATVRALSSCVEVMNRGRFIHFPPGYPAGIVEANRRMRLVRETDAQMLLTGREIVAPSDNDGSRTTGLYVVESRLGIVSAATPSVMRTARHEFGHYLYEQGGIGGGEIDTDGHCHDRGCAMHARGSSHTERRLMVPKEVYCHAKQLASGLQFPYDAAVYETVQVADTVKYCAGCVERLGYNAFVLATEKDNPTGAAMLRSERGLMY